MFSFDLSAQMLVETLDSIIWRNELNERIIRKKTHQYDEQKRDTTVRTSYYNRIEDRLVLSEVIRTSYLPRQTVIEHYATREEELRSIRTIYTDSLGQEVERTLVYPGSDFFGSRTVVTNRTDTTLEQDLYEMEFGELQLAGKRKTVYLPVSGSYISTEHSYFERDLVPRYRSTRLFDENTGVMTLQKLEEYQSNAWVAILASMNQLEYASFMGINTSGNMNASNSNFWIKDSVVLHYNANWQPIYEIRYHRAEPDTPMKFSRRVEYTYTVANNVEIIQTYKKETTSSEVLQLIETKRYYYTPCNLTAVENEPKETIPLQLVYQNPLPTNGEIKIVGKNLTAKCSLEMTSLDGRILSQQEVRSGDSIRIPIVVAQTAGLYFLTLRHGKQLQTWKLVLHL